MKNTNFEFKKLLLLFTIVSLSFNSFAQEKWKRWEKSFTASRDYSKPMRDVDFTVTFNGPGGRSFSVPGFWDSGSTFKVRTAFPATGNWSYSTSSNDAGLKGKSGSISVKNYTGNNALYKNGFIKVSSNKRYLTYDNGKPFLWMGGTTWRGPIAAKSNEWKSYIDNRAGKKFNIIQISSYVDWGGVEPKDRDGNKPFINNDSNKPNPAFWKNLDQKINYANDKGMIIYFAGIPAWQLPISDTNTRKDFIKYFVGRYSGNFVIFSPSADQGFNSVNDAMGNEVNAVTTRHLITQHPNTSRSATNSYYGKAYLDFSANQTGHQNGNRAKCMEAAVKWNLDLYNKNKKPVINVEAFYHGNSRANQAKFRGTDYDARSLGWLSWLSGSMGYTYGAYGLYNWGRNSGGVSVSYTQAMNLNSSTQMKYMYQFFDGIDWFKLQPKHGNIKNNSSNATKKMVYSLANDGSFSVAYLPNNSSIKLNMSGLKSSAKAKWFNPRSGASTQISGTFANNGEKTFNTPGGGDWVLLLEASGTTGGDNTLTASPTSLSFSSGSGSKEVTISSNINWTLSESLNWLSLEKTSGSGNDKINFTVTGNNSSSSRSGTVKLKGSGVNDVTISVSQQGKDTPPPAGDIEFTNITRGYKQLMLNTGVKYYSDRDYTVTSIDDPNLKGKPFIQTANADKSNTTANNFLCFDVNVKADLYIAYDSRATGLPSWLEDGWVLVSSKVNVTDRMGFFKLYKKTYNAGNVCLGGNLASGAAGVGTNYIVIGQKADNTPPPPPPSGSLTSNLIITSGKTYEWFELNSGSKMYIDRNYKFTNVPSSLNGTQALRTANDDKGSSDSSDLITFKANRDVVVYVAYTTRNTTLTTQWLTSANGWGTESATLSSDLFGNEATRLIKSKSFAAGTTVKLKGNGGINPSTSMYNIMVKEATSRTALTIENEVKAYPNPVLSQLTIVNSNNKQGVLYDMFGRVVKSFELKINSKNTVNMNGVKPGFYILKIGKKEIRVVKE